MFLQICDTLALHRPRRICNSDQFKPFCKLRRNISHVFCTFETLLMTISLKLRFQIIVQTSEAQSGAGCWICMHIFGAQFNLWKIITITKDMSTLLQRKWLILLCTWKRQTGENLYRCRMNFHKHLLLMVEFILYFVKA